MGDYDPQADNNLGLADEHGGYAHVIICTSRWLDREPHQHQTVHDVRECWRAFYDVQAGVPVWPCDWLIESGLWDDGTPRLMPNPCSAPSRYLYADDEFSYSCVNGHEHISMERRQREHWDYAADEGEAALLRQYGTDAVAMNGSSI